jgi:hypothetical protein
MANQQTEWLNDYTEDIDPKYEYNPKTNPSLKGDSRAVIEKRLANAIKSKTQRGIDINKALLKNMDEFESSKNKYAESQKQRVKEYLDKQTEYSNISQEVKKKYGFDTSQEDYVKSSPQDILAKRMSKTAREAITKGKGYVLPQDPTNELTCINGVCEVASEAGVNFDKMEGLAGVRKNEKGKYIPQYNVSWTEKDNFKKAGYRRLRSDEQPKEGDFAQYGFEDDKNPNTVDHMEMILEANDKGVTTFNNYKQTKEKTSGAGEEKRAFKKDSKQLDNIADTGYFRLEDEEAKRILAKDSKHNELLKQYNAFHDSEDYVKYQSTKDYLSLNKSNYEDSNKYLSENIPKTRNGGCISCNKSSNSKKLINFGTKSTWLDKY